MDGQPVRQGAEPRAEGRVFVGILRRLGKDLDRLRKIDLPPGDRRFQHVQVFDHPGAAVRLADEAEHFRMADLPEYQEVPVMSVRMEPLPGIPDVPLEFQDHGTGAVDDPEAGIRRAGIGRRRFAVGADQQGRTGGQHLHLGGIHRNKALRTEPFKLGFIMDDGAERIERRGAPGQEILRLPDGADHAAAEAGAGVGFNEKGHFNGSAQGPRGGRTYPG